MTRQGQGGRQSTQDKSGKYAKSMGSQLRRHNEAALERDIAVTLAAWREELARCDLVFVHAPAANGKAVFGEGGVERHDARTRRVPFVTSRPTLTEVKRVLARLAAIEPLDAAALATKAPAAHTKAPPALAGEPPAPASKQRGDAHLKPPRPAAAAPPLHRAAAAGNAALVRQLLDSGADPTVVDAGKVAYEAASSKAVRDEMRRYMAAHPAAWDYVAAHVPSALTEEMEREQARARAGAPGGAALRRAVRDAAPPQHNSGVHNAV